jgi:hypothetical protein
MPPAAHATAGAGAGVAREASPRQFSQRPKASSSTNISRGDDAMLDRLAARVRRQSGKVKLEGYARSKDQNQAEESLKRANIVREDLIARGVAPEKIDVSTSSVVNDAQAVRIVADAPASGAQQPKVAPGENAKDPIGNAYFVTGVPMTIEKDRSAMVSLVKAEVLEEEVMTRRIQVQDKLAELSLKPVEDREKVAGK